MPNRLRNLLSKVVASLNRVGHKLKNMALLKEGKTNWKYILIVLILALLVGGGILGYWWWIEKKEIEVPEVEISKKIIEEEIKIPEVKPPAITVLSPNGGEAWEIGKEYTIKWEVQNPPLDYAIIIGIVRDDYYGAKILLKSIGEQKSSEYKWRVDSDEFLNKLCWQDQSWTVALPCKPSQSLDELLKYKFKITAILLWHPPDAKDEEYLAEIKDTSDNYFSIVMAEKPEKIQDETANWKTYKNEEYGFEFEYPGIYEEKEEYKGCRLWEGTHEDVNPRLFVCVASRVWLQVLDPEGLTFSEYVDKIINKDLELESKKTTSVGGKEAVSLTYRLLGSGAYGSMTLLEKDGKIYMFSLERPTSECDYDLKDINVFTVYSQMLSTFRFLE